MLETEIAFEGSQEGIGHALLSFVLDGEPVRRIQKPCRPLDKMLLATAVEGLKRDSHSKGNNDEKN